MHTGVLHSIRIRYILARIVPCSVLEGAAMASNDTADAIQTEHAKFIETFNTTSHWAHQDREEGLRTPVDVLAWVHGRVVEPDRLRQVLRYVQLERLVDRRSYISVQRFYIYAERGLARQRVSVWLYEGRLHIEYQQTMQR